MSRLLRIPVVAFAAMAALLAAATPASAWFTPATWLNGPADTSPVIDPGSAAWVSSLAGGSHIADIYDSGVPVYVATSGETRYHVDLTNSPAWGPNVFDTDPAPLLSSYAPSTGPDHALVVIDKANAESYEFWQYHWNGGNPYASWGNVRDLNGDARGGATTGAGISRLAGVVRTFEFTAESIPHAIVFSTSHCGTTHRYPATKTDGSVSGGIPEGARLTFPPGIDLSGITDPHVRAIAEAIRVYGAYPIDCGGASVAVVMEKPSGESDPYTAAGWSDFQSLNAIPWGKLRVLAHWDGT